MENDVRKECGNRRQKHIGGFYVTKLSENEGLKLGDDILVIVSNLSDKSVKVSCLCPRSIEIEKVNTDAIQ